MTSPQNHDDPLNDGVAKVLQALAVLTTVGEAAARYAAAGAHLRNKAAERTDDAERLSAAAGVQADRADARAEAARRRADRQLLDTAFDDTHMTTIGLLDTATLWRTSAIYAIGGDPRALDAMHRAQDRLGHLNPGLMTAFHRHRDNARSIADAMRLAAADTWDHQTRGDPDQQASALDEAARAELAALANAVNADALDQLERQWRSGGHVSAADAAARLATAGRPTATEDPRAEAASQHMNNLTDREQQTARSTERDADDPNTEVDEHRDGVDAAQIHRAAGQHDETAAAMHKRLARAFRPLDSVVPVFSHSPAPPPAQQTTARRKGSSR